MKYRQVEQLVQTVLYCTAAEHTVVLCSCCYRCWWLKRCKVFTNDVTDLSRRISLSFTHYCINSLINSINKLLLLKLNVKTQLWNPKARCLARWDITQGYCCCCCGISRVPPCVIYLARSYTIATHGCRAWTTEHQQGLLSSELTPKIATLSRKNIEAVTSSCRCRVNEPRHCCCCSRKVYIIRSLEVFVVCNWVNIGCFGNG